MANPDERHALAYQALKNICIAFCERGDFKFGERHRRQLLERLVECHVAENDLGSDGSLFPTQAHTRVQTTKDTHHG